jgi:hypothetical protein
MFWEVTLLKQDLNFVSSIPSNKNVGFGRVKRRPWPRTSRGGLRAIFFVATVAGLQPLSAKVRADQPATLETPASTEPAARKVGAEAQTN